MDKFLLKNKEYDVVEQIEETFFKVSFDNKFYVIKQCEDYYDLLAFVKIYKRLKVTGISMPRILKKDKKNALILLDYIEGRNVLDIIAEKELDDEIYKLIFWANYYALKERISLDYRPNKWIFDGKKLYYVGFFFESDYDRVQKFEDDGIRYWVYSKELRDYLKFMNKPIDNSRIKHEYEINKQIVLLVCLHHI